MIESILVKLPRGVPSVYYIVTLGNMEFYCDREGLIEVIADWYTDSNHPANQDLWNIKEFNRRTLTLSDVPVSTIAQIINKATKLHLKKIVDNKL